ASGTFSVSRNYDNGVSVSYQGFDPSSWWYVDLAAPGNATLVSGYYGNAQRFGFQPSSVPGMDISRDGRGSNTLTGNFTVKQAVYASGGNVVHFDATFEQHSEGATPALLGEVQYNATPPMTGVLSNDTDPDGDLLHAVLVTGPSHGSLTLNPDGSFSYTPN